MKKIISVLLMFVMMFCITGCNDTVSIAEEDILSWVEVVEIDKGNWEDYIKIVYEEHEVLDRFGEKTGYISKGYDFDLEIGDYTLYEDISLKLEYEKVSWHEDRNQNVIIEKYSSTESKVYTLASDTGFYQSYNEEFYKGERIKREERRSIKCLNVTGKMYKINIPEKYNYIFHDKSIDWISVSSDNGDTVIRSNMEELQSYVINHYKW